MNESTAIDLARHPSRIDEVASFGRTPEGVCSRIALTDEDFRAQNLVADWMGDCGMDVHLDAIGNLIGVLHGLEEGPPVVVGSHIDTVENGGKFDGLLGVVAGLEVASVYADLGKTPKRPIRVVAFTNEEGVRFQPDLMGSAVFSGWLELEDALGSRDSNSVAVGDVSFYPGNINVVPGRAVAKVDLRHPDQRTLDTVVADVSNDVRDACARISLTADASIISDGRVTTFDADLVNTVERAASDRLEKPGEVIGDYILNLTEST
ncbi:MAG: M20/M25/M40 family metallo-hydrolase [bacterium]|nr:M20/M25/M40 family metallo-hydrolase [bacterium]